MLNHRLSPRLALGATQLLLEGSAFLRNLILARLLGTGEMGTAVALALGVRVLEMAGDFGFERMLVQVEATALPAMRRTVHALQLAKGCALALLAASLAAPLAAALDPRLQPAVLALAALSLALRGAVNWDFRERQREAEYLPALLVEGGSNLAGALMAAPLAWITRDYSALAWASVLQAGLMCAMSHASARTRFAPGLDRAALARCLRYGIPVALNAALMFLALQGDRVVVATQFDATTLARYALAAQLALLPALIGARILLAAQLPQLARIAGDTAALRQRERTLLLRTARIAAAGALALGIAGNAVVGLLYGSDFTVEPRLFWLLGAAAALRLVRAVPNTVLMALERTGLLLICNLPRLATVAAAAALAAAGGGIPDIAALGLAGEAISLLLAFGLVAATRMPLRPSGKRIVEVTR